MSDELSDSSTKSLNDPGVAPKLGVELVEILYSNTKLNYDVCAFNLVEVLHHLSVKVPELAHLSHALVHSIEV
jgi:hypothetical protein